MRLKNKKTGEIIEKYPDRFVINSGEQIREYDSLAELNAEWEDAPEEPKGVKEIFFTGATVHIAMSCQEEAKKAVEKLQAWERLKGGGFEFMSCSYGHDKTTDDTGGWIRFRVNHLYDERYGCEVEKDLDLLFGGEE